MIAQTYNPSAWDPGGRIAEFKASLDRVFRS